jgi:hypothetical protein
MSKKNPQTRLQSIGEILFKALKRRGMASKLEENSLFKFWTQAVGPQIAAQTQPDCLRGGTLFVKTTSSVWLQQLHFMKEEIRLKLNELSGKEAIKEIRFSVGHKLAKAKAEENYPATKKIALKERDKRMIEETTGAIADQELAAIIKRVMQVEISRRRQREVEKAR